MISDVYFPRVNGVSTSIRTFHRELTDLGHEVTLVAPEYPLTGKDEDWIIRVPSRYLPMDPEDRMMRRNSIFRLGDIYQRANYDIVHIQTPFVAHNAGINLARRLNIPSVETCHTHFEEYFYHYLPLLPKPIMRYSARWFSRRQCNGVDAVIVPTVDMREVLFSYGIIRPIEVIATGLDNAFFKTGNGALFRCRHGIDPQRPVLVYVGRVAHEKNIDFLLQVLAELRNELPEALLIIAGEGPARTHLRRRAQAMKLEQNIKFIGYLERTADLLDCYCAGDVFVFSSRTETQGLVLLEAMAQGIPVVALSALGTRTILANGKGALVAEERADDFAGKVRSILMEPDLRRRLSHEARDNARAWSARSFANKAASFYERTIASRYLN